MNAINCVSNGSSVRLFVSAVIGFANIVDNIVLYLLVNWFIECSQRRALIAMTPMIGCHSPGLTLHVIIGRMPLRAITAINTWNTCHDSRLQTYLRLAPTVLSSLSDTSLNASLTHSLRRIWTNRLIIPIKQKPIIHEKIISIFWSLSSSIHLISTHPWAPQTQSARYRTDNHYQRQNNYSHSGQQWGGVGREG